MHPFKQTKIDITDQLISITAKLQSTSLIITIDTPLQIFTSIFKQEQATPYQQFFEEPLGTLYNQISKYSESKLRQVVELNDRYISICVAQLKQTDRKAYIRSSFLSEHSDRYLSQESSLNKRMQDIEQKHLKDRARMEYLERKVQDQQVKHIELQKYIDSRMEELNMKIAVLSSKWKEGNPQV